MKRYLLFSQQGSPIYSQMVATFLGPGHFEPINDLSGVDPQEPALVVFAAQLDWLGQDEFLLKALKVWQYASLNLMWGAILVYSEHYWHTKRFSQGLMFILNQRGMSFPGHGAFEVLPEFENFRTWQLQLNLPLYDVFLNRLGQFEQTLYQGLSQDPAIAGSSRNNLDKPLEIVVLHGSQHQVSNTLNLWQMAQKHIKHANIQTFSIENGSVADCKGCAYKTCLHYGQNNSCFYGGQVTHQILPAIEKAQAVVWVSPNYNDALPAMHTALINRLTVLYRRVRLTQKRMYGVVVSGNSGCDSVACQLIGALNINKGFILPSKAILTAIASAPGSIHAAPHIEERAYAFAQSINDFTK